MLHKQDFAGTVVSAGCDWLSFTMKNGAPELPEIVESWKLHLDAEVAQFGAAVACAPQGYHGFKSRHWFAGNRSDGWFFQATSDAAREAVEIARRGGGSVNATRCDLQATVQREHEIKGTYSAIRDALREREARTGGTARRSVALYETGSCGDSVSINSGSSSRTFTIYNKSAEQKGRIAPRLMRFELRLRKQQARGAWRALLDNPSQEEVSKGMITKMLGQLELPLVPAFAEITQSLPTSYYQTDEERRMKWLLEMVAPVARKIEDPKKRQALKIAFGF
jgi:hypothetical protein